MQKRKVNFYVDWFNLYHAILKTKKEEFKWINLVKLFENYIDTGTQELNQIYFFTAYPKWNLAKYKRHKLYVNALMSVWVKIRLWKFNEVNKIFKKKQNKILKIIFSSNFVNFIYKQIKDKLHPDELSYSTHEEKRTDVNIVLQIFEDAVRNNYDDAIIVSWDSDIIPVINSVRKTCKWKKFISLVPYRWKWKEIKRACDENKEMEWQHLINSIFPKTIQYKWQTINSPYIK